MKLKPITTIAILSLVVASLLVAGCTTSTTNNTNQTTSTATTSTAVTHDAFLESYLAAWKNDRSSNSSLNITAWEVTWINNTSVQLQWVNKSISLNQTRSQDMTITKFPTTQDATNYLNAMNTTAYKLASTVYTPGAYLNATGHAPQVYKKYAWYEGNESNISTYRFHEITQMDNFIWVATTKIVG